MTRVVAPISRQRAQWGGMPSLSRALTEKREARARAQNAVRSARFRALTLDVAAWLEVGEWRTPEDDRVRDRGDFP